MNKMLKLQGNLQFCVHTRRNNVTASQKRSLHLKRPTRTNYSIFLFTWKTVHIRQCFVNINLYFGAKYSNTYCNIHQYFF